MADPKYIIDITIPPAEKGAKTTPLGKYELLGVTLNEDKASGKTTVMLDRFMLSSSGGGEVLYSNPEKRSYDFLPSQLAGKENIALQNNGKTVATVNAGDLQAEIRQGKTHILAQYISNVVLNPDKAKNFKEFAAEVMPPAAKPDIEVPSQIPNLGSGKRTR